MTELCCDRVSLRGKTYTVPKKSVAADVCAATMVYHACRLTGAPVTCSEVSSVTKVSESTLAKKHLQMIELEDGKTRV